MRNETPPHCVMRTINLLFSLQTVVLLKVLLDFRYAYASIAILIILVHDHVDVYVDPNHD
eukprot:UN07707